MESLRSVLAAELAEQCARGLYRRQRRLDGAPGPRAVVEGRSLLVLGSNNYLGLTEHPTVRAAAAAAIGEWGTGAGGARLTTGNLALHEALERELAAFKGTEDALLFATGYQANVGTIPALAGRGDLILSDALNHASLIDGCRLSRAEVRVYRHADALHARALLADRHRFRRCLVVTDGVFGMDGDLAPLPDLCTLCEERDAWLMVDDAHGTGVLGPTGAGTIEHFGLSDRVPIQMGTLSKALAAEGGFVAGCRELIDFLRNRARSFLFATAPVPAAVAAARAALGVIGREPAHRQRLAANVAQLRAGLEALGICLPDSPANVACGAAILPVVLGSAEAALDASARLEAAGVWIPAIRPPTVPEGTARLRLSVMATHTRADLDQALAALHSVLRPC
jgi:8-amino-7-oxononanoate synthase